MLMGLRGAGAIFMPNKLVFPGGAVDPADSDVALVAPPPDQALVVDSAQTPTALAAAAIRELWEETGLRFGRVAPALPDPGWPGFGAEGVRPDAGALTFVFRAVTPPGRSRRFDARFFLADAAALHGDPDALAGDGELTGLAWWPLADARQADLAFVTGVALDLVAERLAGRAEGVPFFDHTEDLSTARLL